MSSIQEPAVINCSLRDKVEGKDITHIKQEAGTLKKKIAKDAILTQV